jgi:hypothetical protein
MQVRRSKLALIFLALGTVECGAPEESDLPPGWEAAARLSVDQSACQQGAGPPALMLMRDMGRLRGTYAHAAFRCQQRLCGYRLDAGQTRILVQPCEMDPSAVPKCDCLYTVGFDLPELESGRTVELHRRLDRYGALTEPTPELVGSERAP